MQMVTVSSTYHGPCRINVEIGPLLAVEACLACCASCFVGILQNMAEYFNRYVILGILPSLYLRVIPDTLTSKLVYLFFHIFQI